MTTTGDFSGVVALDAKGNHIPWTEVSRFDDDDDDDDEIRHLMRQAVNYTFQLDLGEPDDRRLGATRKWDDPKHDDALYGGYDHQR